MRGALRRALALAGLATITLALALPPFHSGGDGPLERVGSRVLPSALGQSPAQRLYLPLTGIHRRADLVEGALRPGEGWWHLGSGQIADMAADERRGLLWAATEGGLLRWHPEDDTRVRFGYRPVQLVEVDREGTVWFGGGDSDDPEALQLLRAGDPIPRALPDLPAGSISEIRAEPGQSGGAWVGLAAKRPAQDVVEGGGLLRIDGQGQRRFYDLADGLPSADVTALAPDGQGGVWLAFRENRFGDAPIGVAHLAADGAVRVEGEAAGLENPRVFAMTVGPDGTLLALAEAPEDFVDSRLHERLPDGRWREVSLPRELFDRMWDFYTHDDVHPFSIRALDIDDRGRWWLLAPGGVFLRETDGSWSVFPEKGDAIDRETAEHLDWVFNYPRLLEPLEDGGFWMSNGGELLSQRAETGWRRHLAEGDMPVRYASRLAMDASGQPWLIAGSGYRLGRDARWKVLEDEQPARPDPCNNHHQEVIVATAVDGSVWVGDADAVWQVMPDGSRIKHGGASLAIGRVQVIAFATDGSPWLGGTHGLAHQLPSGAWQRFTREEGLPSNHVRAIVFDALGQIWVGTAPDYRRAADGWGCESVANGGLAHLPFGEGWRSLPLAPGLEGHEQYVLAIAPAPGGVLWAAIGGRLFRRSREAAWQEVSVNLEREGRFSVQDLAFDAMGNLWVATSGDGVRRMSPSGDWDAFGAGGGKIGDEVRTVDATPDGSVWFGLGYRGLDDAHLVRRFADGSWRSYSEGWDAWWAHEIVSIAVDGAGRVWCGTGQDRLLRLDPRSERFETLVVHDRLGQAGGQLNDLASGRDGTLWLGTRDGLIRRSADGSARTWHRAEGLPSATVLELVPDSSGGVWAGFGWGLGAVFPTIEGGIGYLHADGRFEDQSAAAGVVGMQVSHLAVGPADRVLAVVHEPLGRWERVSGSRPAGIAYRDPAGRWQRWNPVAGLDTDAIRAAVFGPDGRMWLATDRGLATSTDGASWERIGLARGLPSEDVRDLAFAPDGSLWAGTGAGAARREPDGRWQAIRPRGVPVPVVDLALDPAGNAWMLLEHGYPVRSLALRLRE